MKILALDTSSRFGSLALCDDDALIAEYTTLGVINQTERLLPVLQRILDDAGWTTDQLEGFAVVHGPGSFTGVRVGLATVQGLALATGRPAVGISSLRALALGLPGVAIPICPVLDARKSEIYTALFEWRDTDLEERVPEHVVDPDRFLEGLEGPVLFVGDGVPVVRARLENHPRVQARLAPGSSSLSRASVIAAWAAHVLRTTDPASLPPLQPRYLRPAEAELKLSAQGPPAAP